MKYFPIFLLLIIPHAMAFDYTDIPTDCPQVGAFAAWVAAQRVVALDEEQTIGKIRVNSKAAAITLMSIVHAVYTSELNPTDAQMFFWQQCVDTNEKADRR